MFIPNLPAGMEKRPLVIMLRALYQNAAPPHAGRGAPQMAGTATDTDTPTRARQTGRPAASGQAVSAPETGLAPIAAPGPAGPLTAGSMAAGSPGGPSAEPPAEISAEQPAGPSAEISAVPAGLPAAGPEPAPATGWPFVSYGPETVTSPAPDAAAAPTGLAPGAAPVTADMAAAAGVHPVMVAAGSSLAPGAELRLPAAMPADAADAEREGTAVERQLGQHGSEAAGPEGAHPAAADPDGVQRGSPGPVAPREALVRTLQAWPALAEGDLLSGPAAAFRLEAGGAVLSAGGRERNVAAGVAAVEQGDVPAMGPGWPATPASEGLWPAAPGGLDLMVLARMGILPGRC